MVQRPPRVPGLAIDDGSCCGWLVVVVMVLSCWPRTLIRRVSSVIFLFLLCFIVLLGFSFSINTSREGTCNTHVIQNYLPFLLESILPTRIGCESDYANTPFKLSCKHLQEFGKFSLVNLVICQLPKLYAK